MKALYLTGNLKPRARNAIVQAIRDAGVVHLSVGVFEDGRIPTVGHGYDFVIIDRRYMQHKAVLATMKAVGDVPILSFFITNPTKVKELVQHALATREELGCRVRTR